MDGKVVVRLARIPGEIVSDGIGALLREMDLISRVLGEDVRSQDPQLYLNRKVAKANSDRACRCSTGNGDYERQETYDPQYQKTSTRSHYRRLARLV